MEVSVSVGQHHHFKLSEALLIYRSEDHIYHHSDNTFITHHAIRIDTPGQRPDLGPATPLTVEFVQALVQSLGGRVPVEFLPENVIARADRAIAWWTPPQKRRMYFGKTHGDMAKINGALFPQPALIWGATAHGLSVRAFKGTRRPTSDTKLCVAPYWNVYDAGDVCLGSMRIPKAVTVASIPQWETSFFESEFTHGNVGRLTRHKGGFEGLWTSLADKARFPLDTLIELPQTLHTYLSGEKE